MFDSRGVGAIPPPLTSHPDETGALCEGKGGEKLEAYCFTQTKS